MHTYMYVCMYVCIYIYVSYIYRECVPATYHRVCGAHTSCLRLYICICMLSMCVCACASSSGTRCSYNLPVPRLVLPRLAYHVEHQDKRIRRGVRVMTVRLPEMPLLTLPLRGNVSGLRAVRALPAHTLWQQQLLESQLQRHPAPVLVRGC